MPFVILFLIPGRFASRAALPFVLIALAGEFSRYGGDATLPTKLPCVSCPPTMCLSFCCRNRGSLRWPSPCQTPLDVPRCPPLHIEPSGKPRVAKLPILDVPRSSGNCLGPKTGNRCRISRVFTVSCGENRQFLPNHPFWHKMTKLIEIVCIRPMRKPKKMGRCSREGAQTIQALPRPSDPVDPVVRKPGLAVSTKAQVGLHREVITEETKLRVENRLPFRVKERHALYGEQFSPAIRGSALAPHNPHPMTDIIP